MRTRHQPVGQHATAVPLADCVDAFALHRSVPERYPFLLQSTATNPATGRFDIVFAAPRSAIVLGEIGELADAGGFLNALDAAWQRESIALTSTTLPFHGGWFLYLGYELAAEIEPTLSLRPDDCLPTAFAARCTAAVVTDRLAGECWVVCEHGSDIDEALIREDIAALKRRTETNSATPRTGLTVREESATVFTDAVLRAKNYIAAGDVYQANLSRGWTATFDGAVQPADVYRRLRDANPGPFAGLVRWHDATILSSSPERLLRLRDGTAATRPIAGTRPRSDHRDTDESLSAELFANAKERAEHVMLIDLERNDLGRICEPGSVEVDERMVLESYAHVHHIVSNVRGRLRRDVTPGAAIRAVFPGGTITGCPKVRCMQII
ncbi:MAG: chorismate-binding protein, partial [Woeseiaceae bacterium]|nr:chorismate-binding protein [Woeseiaceae bacterium]